MSESNRKTRRIISWNERYPIQRVNSVGLWRTYLVPVANRFKQLSTFYADLVKLTEQTGIDTPFIQLFEDADKPVSEPSAVAVVGRIGAGKTSFLNWWCQPSGRSKRSAKIDVIDQFPPLGEPEQTVETFVPINFAATLRAKWLHNSDFKKNFDKLTARLHRECDSTLEMKAFREGFQNQSRDFLHRHPRMDGYVLLTTQIVAITRSANRPVWLIVDNVDLESQANQDRFIRTAYAVFTRVKEHGANRDWDVRFHLIVTARPETRVFWSGYMNYYQDYRYPDPNLLEISIRRLDEAIRATYADLPERLGYVLESAGRTFETHTDVREHILSHIRRAISKNHWPWSNDPQDFHAHLIQFNVRRFISAYVHLLISKNFQELITEIEDDRTGSDISPYRYLRALLRGPFSGFPGNDLIDSTSFDSDTPLFFNLFGLKFTPGTKVADFVRNYFVYLRILQYIRGFEAGVSYAHVCDEIGIFFDTPVFESAIKFLIWTGLCTETSEGVRNVETGHKSSDIELGIRSHLKANETTELYLDVLLKEYEYLAAMAFSSHQVWIDEFLPDEHLRQPLLGAVSTLSFLESMNEIIVENLREYETHGILEQFRSAFFGPNLSSRPWLSAVQSTLVALKRIRRKFSDVERLEDVITRLESLRVEGSARIQKFFDV